IQPNTRLYVIGSPDTAVVRIADAAGPPPFVPEPSCGCSGDCDLTGLADGLSSGFFESSGEGLRYGDGLGGTREADLSSAGFRERYRINRSWTNGSGYTTKTFGGNNTADCGLPFLLTDSAGTVAAVASGATARYFDPSGSAYVARHFQTETLSHNTGAG